MKLDFLIRTVEVDPYSASPALIFKLQLTAPRPVASVALRCQVVIQTKRRSYQPEEKLGCRELFGAPSRWPNSLRDLRWAHLNTVVSRFEHETEVDLPLPCTYDFEVAASQYLHSLAEGTVPLLFLFSGNIFFREGRNLTVLPITSECECSYQLPVNVWDKLMQVHFPGMGWLRLSDETIRVLQRFKAERALLSYDEVIQELLGQRV